MNVKEISDIIEDYFPPTIDGWERETYPLVFRSGVTYTKPGELVTHSMIEFGFDGATPETVRAACDKAKATLHHEMVGDNVVYHRHLLAILTSHLDLAPDASLDEIKAAVLKQARGEAK